MTVNPIHNDDASTSTEFALSAPLYVLLLFGVVQIGLWFWAATALQHGVEAAARCASVSKATCSSASTIGAYAAQHSLGLPVTAASFTSSQASCGNRVTVSYSYLNFVSRLGLPAPSIRASACVPL
jgi:Flp pilus assembly protein TadG